MVRFFSFLFPILILILLFPPVTFCQTSESSSEEKPSMSAYSEEEFQVSLTNYVQRLLTNYYAESLPQERFLVSLMRLVNHEMENRITNRREAIERYFTDLRNQLSELQQLEARLENEQIYELKGFTTELERRMKMALESGEINYKQKKVVAVAPQVLHIAEEMIKMDQLSDRS